LKHYHSKPRRRWRLVAVALLLAIVYAYAAVFAPQWRSHARVDAGTNTSASDGDYEGPFVGDDRSLGNGGADEDASEIAADIAAEDAVLAANGGSDDDVAVAGLNVDSGLAFHYDFDDDIDAAATAKAFTDRSGNERHGAFGGGVTVANAAAAGGVSPACGKALHLDGASVGFVKAHLMLCSFVIFGLSARSRILLRSRMQHFAY
jgi:hypothetical protein